MSYCRVCNRPASKNPQLSFFRFPKDPEKCKKWLSVIPLPNISEQDTHCYYKSYRICSDHFDKQFIYWDGSKNRLRCDAVPTLLNVDISSSVTSNKEIKTNNCEAALEIEKILACDDSEFRLDLLDNVCRMCGEERHGKGLTRIFGPRGQKLQLQLKFKFIPVIIVEDDHLPKKICSICISKVEENYQFISKCLEAEKKLKCMMDSLSHFSAPNTVETNSIVHLEVEDPLNLKPADFSTSCTLSHDYGGLLLPIFVPKNIEGFSKRVDSSIKKYNCDKCPKSFKTDDVRNAHAKAHDFQMNESGLFECTECCASFKNRFRLAAHLRRHFDEKPYMCSKCGSRFFELTHLKQHRQTHLKKTFKCELCKKWFMRKASLKVHLNNHQEDRSNKKQTNKRARSVEKHLDLPTPENRNTCKGKQLKCVLCPKSFPTLAGLGVHWKRHWSPRQFLCSHCGKRFTRMDSLTNHTRIHTGERPFSCSICGFSFKQKGDCKKHEANHQKT